MIPEEWSSVIQDQEFERVELDPDEADELTRYMDLDQTYSIQDDDHKKQMLTHAMRAFVYEQLQEQNPNIVKLPHA